MKSQGIKIVLRIHPLGTTDICSNFNPSTSCQGISRKNNDIRGLQRYVGFILWGPWTSVQNNHGSLSKRCWHISMWTKVTIQLTAFAIPRAVPLPCSGGATEKVMGSLISEMFIPLGSWMCSGNFPLSLSMRLWDIFKAKLTFWLESAARGVVTEGPNWKIYNL